MLLWPILAIRYVAWQLATMIAQATMQSYGTVVLWVAGLIVVLGLVLTYRRRGPSRL
jgi:hypothetical protein